MIDFLVGLWNSLLDLVAAIFLSLFEMLKDLVYFLVDGLLGAVVGLVNGFGQVMDFASVVPYLDALPFEVKQTLALSGISQAIGILITAITIRFLLQLIPFVRLGS